MDVLLLHLGRQDDTESRSSRPEVFLRKGVLKICNQFTRGHPCGSMVSINVQSNFQI